MSSPSCPESTAFVDRLVAEMERLGGRTYEEVGIPTFFVGEHPTTDVPTSRADDELATTFAALAGALSSRLPQPAAEDIGKLIQVVADHHFPHGGADAAPADLPPVPPMLASTAIDSPVLSGLVDAVTAGRAIRAVNFHATPSYRAEEYRRQIAAYATAFEPITPANFASAVEGRWDHPRPGLMPLLFEGFRDNLDVMLPILEEHGFVGWFFVPSMFLGMAASDQRDYAAEHDLDPALTDEYPGDRIALTWDEARAISRRGHVFACHSRTHNEVKADTPRAVLEDEIVAGKQEMEAGLGHGIDIFCWLGGADVGVNPEADAMLRAAGFRYLLSNFKIQQL